MSDDLIADCLLAVECLAETNTFETGQAILKEAADRIEELEAKLAKVMEERDEWRSLSEATIKDDAAKNIHYAEIQAKLAKAVECQYLNDCIEMVDELYDSSLAAKARDTIAELKG